MPTSANDLTADPYWWRAAPPRELELPRLETSYDVTVVGAGYTGLRAALELARAGLKVLVCERDKAGYGASRRNAGFLGRTFKKSFPQLSRRYGQEYAQRVYAELDAAYRATFEFIDKERIACFAMKKGRFIAATSPAHLEQLALDYEALHRALAFPYSVVGKTSMGQEIGSPLYHGGIVVPDLGALHPALYHEGLLTAALAAGVAVATGTEVRFFERDNGSFQVSTSRGRVSTGHVVIATNGYTPYNLRWFARRVIPFTGYMAATEELNPGVLKELIPNDRTIIDSNINVDFFRTAPDASRLLFGGSAGASLAGTPAIAARLSELLARVFPQLRGTRLSAVWSGLCAGTFDMMPHMGSSDGVWYGLGYNFAGVPLGPYLGLKIAQGILGSTSERSVFSEPPFKSFPLYSGNPWFVPLAMRFFAWQDQRLAQSKRRRTVCR